jgi:cell division inhibitor SepF
MSALHRFKAYFGMVPLEDYEDDYLDEPAVRRERSRGVDWSERGQRADDEGYGRGRRPVEAADPLDELYPSRRERGYDYEAPRSGRAVAYAEDYDDHYGSPRRGSRSESAPLSAGRSAGRVAATRGALAMDTSREVDARSELETTLERVIRRDDPLSRITTLRPRDYGEARTIGERFRDGTPVIMDLVEMSNSDAKRLVDFAAGLAFALRGSFDKVATKVFLLSPADVDVSAADRRRLADRTGFHPQG